MMTSQIKGAGIWKENKYRKSVKEKEKGQRKKGNKKREKKGEDKRVQAKSPATLLNLPQVALSPSMQVSTAQLFSYSLVDA
jgi:hypothetical protein